MAESVSTYSGAKIRALAIAEELQRRDEALRELLSYCEQNTKTPPYPMTGMTTAYGDVATKLATILDGDRG